VYITSSVGAALATAIGASSPTTATADVKLMRHLDFIGLPFYVV